jgi:hypothetical protein
VGGKRVLVAVSPRAAQRMGRVLHGFEVELAHSVRGIAAALRRDRFDLVIVGAHFDRSNAMHAVTTVRSLACDVPLACVRAAPFSTGLGEGTLAAFRAASEELGVDCFVDLLEFPDDDAGNARARAVLERRCLCAK